MDPEPNRFFLAFIIFFSFICKISYAEQYYDRQTRRYIEVGQQPATPQQFQRPKYPQRAMPTQSEIEIERQKTCDPYTESQISALYYRLPLWF